eukprot:CAMPEP_0115880088 /NCGR_PEP_ID=MMETSP0287-20121206/27681_1 /TAXON_ID=412157 /ORGANISM="Chrysochromulina rotalis, Strain UIO044" /LENGTH=94 /DNA_ID=CAMNT_0003335869 /DNA_START=256 /DNA_END=537 /DNA_ORIENTATION=+
MTRMTRQELDLGANGRNIGWTPRDWRQERCPPTRTPPWLLPPAAAPHAAGTQPGTLHTHGTLGPGRVPQNDPIVTSVHTAVWATDLRNTLQAPN